MNHRIAIIDLGTNTFHLLIVDLNPTGYSVVFRKREAVKLGLKGINKGMITNDALDRALISITDFKEIINQKAVQKIYAYGTSALRSARNKDEVLLKIKQSTDITVTVISGDEEARLIYKGVRSAIPFGKQKALIMDIGGGSVEFIIGNDSEIFWKESFEIGAQRLLEEYQQHDPILPTEIVQLQQHFEVTLHPLFDALQIHKPLILAGSSGTFDTLSDMYCITHGIQHAQNENETPLTFRGFKEIYTELLSKDRNERMQMPGMIEMRVDMIVVASCLIDFLITKHPFESIRVSNYAMKEGVLAELIEAYLNR